MTIKEKIALLESMLRNTEKCAENMRDDGDDESADMLNAEADGVRQALWVLTDKDFAEHMREIYGGK